MTNNFSIKKDYWLIFSKGDSFWQRHFLKEGFGHLTILTHDDFNWYTLDPRPTHLNIEILHPHISTPLPKLLSNKNCYVLKITTGIPDKERSVAAFRYVSCIRCCLYILGIDFFALTPYSLYKKLLTMSDRKLNRLGIWSVTPII